MEDYDSFDRPFHEIVAADIKNKVSDEEKLMLRRPHNLDRWHRALLELKKNVEAQFEAKRILIADKEAEYLAKKPKDKKEFLSAKAEYDKWRSFAYRFRGLVETTIKECEKLQGKKEFRKRGRNSTIQKKMWELLDEAAREYQEDDEWYEKYMWLKANSRQEE